MWEQIRINKRNSMILLTAMAGLLLGLGGLLGYAFVGPQGVGVGILIAGGVWLLLTLISFSSGDQILLASSGAVEVTPEVHPMLFNIVEEMKIAAQLPAMPKVYIIPDPSPNAFATGRNPSKSAVAVTEGLLAKLNRDELQGVIAHEVSHIVHRDILFVTLAGIMLGTIVLLADVFLRGTMYGSHRRYSSRDNNNAQGLMIIIALVAAILAPLMAQILYFALSRKREFLADAGAVRLTRYPEGLASALEKISGSKIPMETANKVTAPMYISSPFRGAKANLFSTHPSAQQRIHVLRAMMHGANYQDYDQAYRSVTGKSGVIPAAALKESEAIPTRQADTRSEPQPQPAAKAQQRILFGDFIRKQQGFAFIDCPCGVKLKLPPNLPTSKVQCPRCKTVHTVTQS
ncbi:MAG TPA: M48 family metallopeptidase [Anaerohalosphaeraceae bacterium]|nr:M48 family metallopeptidase [Anaerohalosphaeraceae bacterium]